MRFVFAARFYFLLAAGLIPLSISWSIPGLRYFVVAFDLILLITAAIDYFLSRGIGGEISTNRAFERRFAIGDSNRVSLHITNNSAHTLRLRVKDEYPHEMILEESREADLSLGAHATAEFYFHLRPMRRGQYVFGRTAVRYLSRLGLIWCQADVGETATVKVYPNLRRARELYLQALGAQSFVAVQRRAVRRGEGRDFESMRDYVRGDEMRHISWTATARRSRLITRQYQIERDQTVIIALDAGRLMSGRIGGETKFDTAIHASLALMSATVRAGDNCGLLVFGRRVRKFLPPKRGVRQFDAVLEALHDVEPDLVEPSYARAFQFIASSTKKRAFIVILTDVIDKDSSKELVNSLRLLRPRHLPLVATIGDRDLGAGVSQTPTDIRQVFHQSAAHEIIRERESALRLVESLGGLALDVTTQTLGPRLLEAYLKVKSRGLL